MARGAAPRCKRIVAHTRRAPAHDGGVARLAAAGARQEEQQARVGQRHGRHLQRNLLSFWSTWADLTEQGGRVKVQYKLSSMLSSIVSFMHCS